LLGLLIKIKKIAPPWVRITRLIRDIPEESIVAGNKITNLRQLINEQAIKDGWSCKCIRCREAGHAGATGELKLKGQKSKLINRKYQADGGTEYFLSFESPDEKILYAFLRLRLPEQAKKSFLPELQNAALIRELHTYGRALELGGEGQIQHLGLGKKLLAEAEKLARQKNYKKIAIIAGVGVREYYKKLNYNLEGTYMLKHF
jgi:elongator complex protein 3